MSKNINIIIYGIILESFSLKNSDNIFKSTKDINDTWSPDNANRWLTPLFLKDSPFICEESPNISA